MTDKILDALWFLIPWIGWLVTYLLWQASMLRSGRIVRELNLEWAQFCRKQLDEAHERFMLLATAQENDRSRS